MNVLFDINVILDVLFERQPFMSEALTLFAKVEHGEMNGVIAASAVTTIFYLTIKVLGKAKTEDMLHSLLGLFQVAPVNRLVIEEALQSQFANFEDAVIYQSGRHFNVDALVTRNTQDFKKAKIPVYSPVELLKILNQREAKS